LAASVAQKLRRDALRRSSPVPRLVVVEPEPAACVGAGLNARAPIAVPGDLATCAEMLSCGLASAMALRVLLDVGALAVTASEPELESAAGLLGQEVGMEVTPSSAAGLAGLIRCASDQNLRSACGLDGHSCVLLVATEAAPR
jgi:diaminopropionate ammonia-lyase